jgi:2-succinyl-6-hydroxy-2,4-cyclohexadiene-1-carboxylate synthase
MIVAVHGFFGVPADWDFLRDSGLGVAAVPFDKIPPRGDVLLGYSMGGRLALEALLNGARYRRAVIVSAGLGLDDERDRATRLAADEQWAHRFESEPWDELTAAWDAQPLFGGHTMVRQEKDFDRRKLAETLRRYSPAAMAPLAPRLTKITTPVLWIAGERDQKYLAEAERAVRLLRKAELWVCPGAAHRVPWEQPGLFTRRMLAV